jgi:hypothetical protein
MAILLDPQDMSFGLIEPRVMRPYPPALRRPCSMSSIQLSLPS